MFEYEEETLQDREPSHTSEVIHRNNFVRFLASYSSLPRLYKCVGLCRNFDMFIVPSSVNGG